MTEHRAGGDARIAHHHCLDPFRRNVPARRGDEEIVLSSGDREIAVAVDAAEIAGPPRWLRRRARMQISRHDRRSADHHLALLDPHIEAGQRLANGSRLAAPRPVDGYDRAAFGQAIAFMHGDAELPGPCGQRLRNGCAADRDKAQAFGPGMPCASSWAIQPESNCGTSTVVVGCPHLERASISAGRPAPRLSATAEAKCVRAPTRTGTQMAAMVSSSKESGRTER